jgi:hypothetical protein
MGIVRVFFRQGSKNSFNSALKTLRKGQKTSLLKYLEIEGECLPHQNAIDDYLANVDPNQINACLMNLFKSCIKNKIFYNHSEILLPGNSFHLGVDGFWVHHYNKPHATDTEGHNNCPYCLPRVHKKGTAEEYTSWIHVFVPFVMIFPGGLTLPIYLYPLKSEQVNISANTEELKQECELVAAHIVLPKIREQLPRIPITFLGDGLYCNQPFVKLCDYLSLDYAIVQTENSLPTVRRECDQLAKTENHKIYSKQISELSETKNINSEFQWFNNRYLGSDTYTNILRFKEINCNSNGNSHTYKNEWLISKKINKTTCKQFSERGRLRWHQEDFHNTLKNRGFAAEHDYARANPKIWLNWKLLMVLAFSIFELFSHTQLAIDAKGTRSWKQFAVSLFAELVNVLWSDINDSHSLQKQKIQFRYVFDTS